MDFHKFPKTATVVIPDCLCISKGLKKGICWYLKQEKLNQDHSPYNTYMTVFGLLLYYLLQFSRQYLDHFHMLSWDIYRRGIKIQQWRKCTVNHLKIKHNSKEVLFRVLLQITTKKETMEWVGPVWQSFCQFNWQLPLVFLIRLSINSNYQCGAVKVHWWNISVSSRKEWGRFDLQPHFVSCEHKLEGQRWV